MSALKRTPMRKKAIRRDWSDALQKVESEGACRACGSTKDLEAAHVIGRECDVEIVGPKGGKSLYVHPDAIVPLCGAFSEKACHMAYDAHELDLLPYLTQAEQERAVQDAGGLIAALNRTTGGRA